MSVTIKSDREIALMREAGSILARVHEALAAVIKPGVTTYEINKIGDQMIRDYGCIPSFLNYNGYPASICISVNNEVVHGIPSKKRRINEGDIVSLDIGLIYKGYHSDAARTHAVGEVSLQAHELIENTKRSFFEGIKFAKEGYHLNDISKAIYAYCRKYGYGVVQDLVGHGIGQKLHEDPQVPNFPQIKRGIKLRAGMTLAIEPMVNAGGYKVNWLQDRWTVVTADGSLSAHYENTVLITEGEPEILSWLE